MQRDSMRDSTRVVVCDEHYGGVLPGNRAELWRDIYLRAPADVRGALFGNRLTIDGPSRVREAVWARSQIEIEGGAGEPAAGAIVFDSCVATAGSILVNPGAPRVRILSNLYSDVANLRNTIVYGNLYARTATLENCVVLGGVYVKRKLRMTKTLVATFSAGSVELAEDVGLLFPVAASGGELTLKSTVRAFSFLKLSGEISPEVKGGTAELTTADVYPVPEIEGSESDKKLVLSLDPRVLDGGPVMERFIENRRLLEDMALRKHRGQAVEQLAQGAVAEVEDRLFAVASGHVPPSLSGQTNLSDVMARDQVRDTLEQRFSAEAVAAMDTLESWSEWSAARRAELRGEQKIASAIFGFEGPGESDDSGHAAPARG